MIKAIALALSLFATSAMAADITSKVTLSEVNVASKGRISTVDGVMKNTTGATLKKVFVTFKLYNGNGEVVGTALDGGQDIESGESWRFSATSTVKFAKAKLTKVESY